MSDKKNVRSLVLDVGASYAIIDLEDTPGSIEVSLSDGVITFREGFGLERIHGWVLTPNSVERFTVDRVDGRAAIRLEYRRRGILTIHFVGYVRDHLSAEKWIERVNAVYAERMEKREKRSKGRKTEYREFPVVNDILEKGVNIVLPGTYQYSWQDPLLRHKLSLWEEAYVSRCIDLLAQEAGVRRQSLKRVVRRHMPHDYDWLTDRIYYSADNFKNRITQPLELIFDRHQRHDSIGVNSFSYVPSFALVYFKKSKVKQLLGGKPKRQLTSTLHDFFAQFESVPSESHLLICAPAHQSVYYTFYDAHLAGEFDLYRNFHRRTGIDSLAAWLWQNVHNGIVACDLGEVKQLIDAVSLFQGFESRELLEYVLIPYETPIPAGFCYRKDDEMWARIGNKSLIDILEDPHQKIKADVGNFKKRVAEIGIVVAAA